MNRLLDRIYGCLIGSAIGDAMGGPVEGLHYTEISKRYGRVETLLPYTEVKPSYHGPFSTQPGSYTDDTRLSIILAEAAVHAGGLPKKGDIAHALAAYYFQAETELEQGFIEEYYLKGVYGEEKEAFGGRPTNGGIMGIASLGALFPGAAEEAFAHVFQNLFLSTGTARTASALAAAMIGAAMDPENDWKEVLSVALSAAETYKRSVETGGWRGSSLYPDVAVKSEQLVRQAIALGTSAEDVRSFYANLYKAVVQPYFADGSESLAIAAAMFSAGRGDFAETVIGCVNFGRDNDSSAAVGGAIAGAFCGASRISPDWIALVESVNPGPTLKERAELLTGLTMRRFWRKRDEVHRQEELFFPAMKLSDLMHDSGSDVSAGELSKKIADAHSSTEVFLSWLANHAELERVLQTGTNPDKLNSELGDMSGKTLLHIACAKGYTESTNLLLLYGAEVNSRDANRTTPLHFAAWEHHPECIRLLLAYGADPDLSEGAGWTALHDALRREYLDIAVELLAGSRKLSGRENVEAELSKLTGDVRFLALLQLLQISCIRLDAVGICGQSLLHDAVERGYRKAVRYLIDQGVNIDQLATTFGNTHFAGTPLHKAAACGWMDIYEDLIAAGADEAIRNIDGLTPPELIKEQAQ